MYNNNEGEKGRYILQELKDPGMGTPEFQEMYRKFSKRILWIDNNVMPGSFQMNTAWYYAVPEKDPVFEEHVHEYDELIGFFGSDPENPYDLGAELDVTLDGEVHRLTKTSLLFVPAGVPHMPLSIRRVDRPVFHFSIVVGPEYNGGAYQ
ncbi:MAG: hypothetical protein LUC27_05245 [Lachnospiraceae bacterium]|nr:hypothetical protein [Lachnospiraceae bacterium]